MRYCSSCADEIFRDLQSLRGESGGSKACADEIFRDLQSLRGEPEGCKQGNLGAKAEEHKEEKA